MVDTEPRTADGPPHRPTGDAVIVARGLRRVFGKEVAVDRVDLEVQRGTIFGFVGPSGSGKTTTIRLLTGIDAPSEGEVEVLGRSSKHFGAALRRRLGYMPQLSVHFPNLSVRENLSFVASLYGLPIRRRERLHAVLERTELLEHRRKPVRDLSGGMQRRLALSSALVHEPELLFLDEPTAGIDPVLRRKLWDWFESLRDEGRTLFVTTQYVGEAAYCDRVAVIAEGRIVAEDTPQGLRRQALGGDVIELTPATPFSETELGKLRDLDGVRSVSRPGDDPTVRVVVDAADQRLADLQQWADRNDLIIESLREHHVPFDDIFAFLIEDATEHEPEESFTS